MSEQPDTTSQLYAHMNGWRNGNGSTEDLDSLRAGVHRRATRDRITRDIPPVRWDWYGYLPRPALCVIHGMGGLSKSVLAQALAAARSQPQGGYLLDRPVAPGRTLYLDAENDDDIVDDRLRRLGVHADAEGLTYHTVDPALLGRAYKAGLLDEFLCDQIADADSTLAILDSKGTQWGLDELKDELEQAFYDALNRVRVAMDCTIVVIGHDNRGGSYRGLAHTHNLPQVRLHVMPFDKELADGRKEPDEPITDLVLAHGKMRRAATQKRLRYTLDWGSQIRLVPNGTHAGKLQEVVRAVREAGGRVVASQSLCTRFGLPKNWLGEHAGMLHMCGLERDNEVDLNRSSGWRDTAPQTLGEGVSK